MSDTKENYGITYCGYSSGSDSLPESPESSVRGGRGRSAAWIIRSYSIAGGGGSEPRSTRAGAS